MDLLADRLTRSELQRWGSSLKGSGDIRGGTESSGFRTRAEGDIFFQTEVLAEAIVPL